MLSRLNGKVATASESGSEIGPTIEKSQWKDYARLPLPRGGCTVGVLDGRLVVAGGTYWDDGRKVWSDRVDIFDREANRWEPAVSMPAARGDAAGAVHQDALYLIGGGAKGSAEASVWRFRHGAWSEVPEMKLPAPRRSPGVAVWNDTIYIVGGFEGEQLTSAASTCWASKPGEPWKVCAPMPGPLRFSPAIASIPGGIILGGGGTVENGQVRNLDDVMLYNAATDAWAELSRLPAASRAGSAVFAGSRVLLLGGYTTKFNDEILELNPETGSVRSVGKLPHPLADSRFVRIGSVILGVSGECGDKVRAPWTFEMELVDAS